MENGEDGLRIAVTSPQILADALEAMAEGVDSVTLLSGGDMDTETAKQILTAIRYARWIL